MAYYGIAANLLAGGVTLHSFFRMPLKVTHETAPPYELASRTGQRLKGMDVLIWDEAPMAVKFHLEYVDRALKFVMQNDVPFGGKIIILGGDNRQVLYMYVQSCLIILDVAN